ncbi:response regulator transcription factor [Chitinophaga filiformis]|uniref:DNA-binding response regulator, NarL/FixJ family, contains REC and HTH domains n=1 Tax=Chitinophaga filiformis TaxID=104663 RepID=A0A1G8CSM2_CHIFI|nr:response regulator transcription factor [Chitinophaga filiformis]SDH48496.1 DNA-binding response regulator, NarL/FixJ family, contains REC and HTH domains [Chitinophaga filiformis]
MNYILIAHEPSIARDGLSQIITMLPAPVTVLMVVTADDVMAAMKKQTFNLLILSRYFPGIDTLSMMNAIRKQSPATRILLYSSHSEKAMIIDSLYQEADACLSKNSTAEEIQLTLSSLLKEEKEMPLYVPSSANPLAQLSSREIEVMNLLIKGLPLLKIAAKMELQLTTVSTYKTRIFKKLEINSIVELLEKINIYGARKAV